MILVDALTSKSRRRWEDTWQKSQDSVARFCEPMIRRLFMTGTGSISASPAPTDVFSFPREVQRAYIAVAFFLKSSEYFPLSQPAMLNFQVDNLDAVLERLSAAGASVDPRREDYDFGRFGWFTDPEGNRVELCQPPA
jgi:catechol 2,3-dioxygenase-like lactoylglutathione lyase family enzyme